MSQENTMYFMHANPQAIHTNPALFYTCFTYIELPGISSVKYSYANSGFAYRDAFNTGTGINGDSISINFDRLDKKMKNRNYIRNDYSVNILGAGFRIKDYYFHFNISNHGETRIGLPGDLIALKDGNWDSEEEVPRDFDLGGLGVIAVDYIQIAAGVSTRLSEKLSVGLTAKYLMGSAGIINRKSRLELLTESDPLVLNAIVRYNIYSSFPVVVRDTTGDGIVDIIDFGDSFTDPVGDYIFNRNNGFAIDAGILYDYSEKILLSASIINLGFIRWRSNINRLESEGSFTFRGFDLSQYTPGADESELFQALVDSVSNSFRFYNNHDPFTSLLTPKIYIGGLYKLNKKLAFGGLLRTDLFDLRPHFALTLTANYNPVDFFSGTLSYSIMNNRLYNIGFGFSLGRPGAQLFFVTDNIPLNYVRETNTGIIFPYSARTLNFRAGINLIFGCRELKWENRPKAYRYVRARKLCPAYD